MAGRQEIRVSARAKINLFLELLAKRPDGYHEIETWMASIELCDELILKESAGPDGVTLNAQWADGVQVSHGGVNSSAFGQLPPQEKNLAFRALELLRSKHGVQKPVSVTLIKRIPSEAGLGGASADAAAALLAGNTYWELGLSLEELSKLAAQLGSDVPFFLHGGYALCQGRGEIVTPVEDIPPVWVVVVKPLFGLSTPRVYANCKIPDAPYRIEPLIAALKNRDEIALSRQLVNRLWEPALSIEPRLSALPEAFKDAGFLAHQMSGSGSSYFGVTFDRMKAMRAAAILRNRSLGFTWVGRGGQKN